MSAERGTSSVDGVRYRSPMSNAVKFQLAWGIDSSIRQIFPRKYHSLCHVYAIVGANVLSIVLGREYRPVAGLAKIDCGAGTFLELVDDGAYSTGYGGAYHCWIESHADQEGGKEFVDLTYKNNPTYAKKHNMMWRKKAANYLWGNFSDYVIRDELDNLPNTFPDGKLWVRETNEGAQWLNRQVSMYMDEYVKATSFVLKKINTTHPHLYMIGKPENSPVAENYTRM